MLDVVTASVVAAPMLVAEAPIDLPQTPAGSGQADVPAGPVVVSILGDGRVFLGEAEVADGDLAAAVGEATNDDTGAAIIVRAEEIVDFAAVRTVLEELNGAGFHRVGRLASPVPQDN